MAEKLAQRTALLKAKLCEDSGAGYGRNLDVTRRTVVLPAEAACSKRTKPNLHLGHGVTPQTQVPQLTQHMPVGSVQARERNKPHRGKERIIRAGLMQIWPFLFHFSRVERIDLEMLASS